MIDIFEELSQRFKFPAETISMGQKSEVIPVRGQKKNGDPESFSDDFISVDFDGDVLGTVYFHFTIHEWRYREGEQTVQELFTYYPKPDYMASLY